MFGIISSVVGLVLLLVVGVALYMNREKIQTWYKEKTAMGGARVGVFSLSELAQDVKALWPYNEPDIHAGEHGVRGPAQAPEDLLPLGAPENVMAGHNLGPVGISAVEDAISRPVVPGSAAGGFQISTADTWTSSGMTRASLEKMAAEAKAQPAPTTQWGQPPLF